MSEKTEAQVSKQNYFWMEQAPIETVRKCKLYLEEQLRYAKYKGRLLLMVPVWEQGLKKAEITLSKFNQL